MTDSFGGLDSGMLGLLAMALAAASVVAVAALWRRARRIERATRALEAAPEEARPRLLAQARKLLPRSRRALEDGDDPTAVARAIAATLRARARRSRASAFVAAVVAIGALAGGVTVGQRALAPKTAAFVGGQRVHVQLYAAPGVVETLRTAEHAAETLGLPPERTKRFDPAAHCKAGLPLPRLCVGRAPLDEGAARRLASLLEQLGLHVQAGDCGDGAATASANVASTSNPILYLDRLDDRRDVLAVGGGAREAFTGWPLHVESAGHGLRITAPGAAVVVERGAGDGGFRLDGDTLSIAGRAVWSEGAGSRVDLVDLRLGCARRSVGAAPLR